MYSKHLTKRLSTIMTSLTAYLKIRKVTLGNLQAEFFFSRAPKQSQIFSKILMSYAEPFFWRQGLIENLGLVCNSL